MSMEVHLLLALFLGKLALYKLALKILIDCFTETIGQRIQTLDMLK